MKTPALVLLVWLAGPVAAAYNWHDDGRMATALSNSRWTITTVSGMRVEDPQESGRFQVNLVPDAQELTLSVSPLLRDTLLDGNEVGVTLLTKDLAQDGRIRPVRNTLVMPFPGLDDSARDKTDLFAILVTSSRIRSLGTRMVVRATQSDRMVGILQVSGIKSLYAPGAALYNVEASPAL